jgi:Uma2 family endonuclease
MTPGQLLGRTASWRPRHRSVLHVDDLVRTEGKGELIGGRIVHFMPSGFTPSQVVFETAVSLREFAKAIGQGFPFGDGMGFTVPELRSGRESFCPDAAYYFGAAPAKRMRFVEAPPTFAVEVRSEIDSGPAPEQAIATKRAGYFAAGTQIVWDVDPEAELILIYRTNEPNRPTI